MRYRLTALWPLTLVFAAFPLWWLLGVSAFLWSALAVPLVIALAWRGWRRAPSAALLWLAFVCWALLSGLQITSGTRALSFGYRWSLYLCAGLLLLYVYNLPRSRSLDARVLRLLTIFWVIVVAFGFLDILLAGRTYVPPAIHLMPHSIRKRPFTQELMLPVFAQVQHFLGFPVPRPAAPFSYTNQWGGNMAVLTFAGLAAFAAAGRGRRRLFILGVLAASLVPMAVSLNRGMFLSIAVGVSYMALRLGLRGRARTLASLAGLTAVLVAVVALTPLGHLIVSSFSSTHGNSNSTRLSVYAQTSAGVSASPWFGYGAPQQSAGQAGAPAIGTQGQVWLVLYSHGYPALALFLAFFLAVLWQTRRAQDVAGLWLHTAVLVALSQVVVYGWLPAELQVVMVVAALAYRRSGRGAVAAKSPPVSRQPAAGGGHGLAEALP